MSEAIHEVKYDVAAKLKVINLKQLSLLPEKKFSFAGYEVTMSPEAVKFAMLRICFLQIAKTLSEEFDEIYRSEYVNLYKVKNNTLDQVAMFINAVLEGVYDLLVSQGMENVDFDAFVKTYYASRFDFYSYFKEAALDKSISESSFSADETRVKIVAGLYKNIYKVIYAYTGAIEDYFGVKACDVTSENKKRADKMFQELLQLEKGKEKMIADILNCDPYKKEAYEFAVLKDIDKKRELGDIAKLCSVDLSDTAIMYIYEVYKTVDRSDRIALSAAMNSFREILNRYHIPETRCSVLPEIEQTVAKLTRIENSRIEDYYRQVRLPFIKYAEKLRRVNDGFHIGIVYVGDGKDGTKALRDYAALVISEDKRDKLIPILAWKDTAPDKETFFFTENEVCVGKAVSGGKGPRTEFVSADLSEIKDFGAKHQPKKSSELVAMMSDGSTKELGFTFDKIDTSYFLGIFQLSAAIVKELREQRELSGDKGKNQGAVADSGESSVVEYEFIGNSDMTEANAKTSTQKIISESDRLEAKLNAGIDALRSGDSKEGQPDKEKAPLPEGEVSPTMKAENEVPEEQPANVNTANIEELCRVFTTSTKNDFEASQKLISKLGADEEEKVFAGYDSSILTNGKSGFLITEKGIYCKIPFKKQYFTSWEDFAKSSDIRFKNDFEGVIFAGDNPVAYIMTLNVEDDKKKLFELFNSLHESFKSADMAS